MDLEKETATRSAEGYTILGAPVIKSDDVPVQDYTFKKEPPVLYPMKRVINLDDTVYTCPCGANYYPNNSYEDTKRWLHLHKPHCNGKILEHTSADGNRAWGSPAPDELDDFPSPPAPLFPDGDFVFVVDGGKEYREGKAYWPAHLRFQMPARDALRFIEKTIRKIADNGEINDVLIEMKFPGTIKRLEPE